MKNKIAASDTPLCVKGLGVSFFLGFEGQKWAVEIVDPNGKIVPRAISKFSKLISSKKIGGASYEPQEEFSLIKLFTH